MRDLAALHNQAMEFADRAAAARRDGDEEEFLRFTREALEKETEAAALAADHIELEPTRSVLHRSAASLALECGEIRLAEQLIARALSGQPPNEVAEELRDLLEDVYFRRHLSTRGVALEAGEFQMSLDGEAVGFGMTRTDHFVGRVKDLEALLYRTGERRLGREFREAGRRQKALSEELELYLSAPRAASFAVTFRVGRSEQLEIPGTDFSWQIVEELLQCMALVNDGNFEELRKKIPDESYLRNFAGLVKRIAPDGDLVRTVGFTTRSGDDETVVAFTRPKEKLVGLVPLPEPAAGLPSEPSPEPRVVNIRGTLLEADARKQREGVIQVVSSDGTEHQVSVPRGLMSDIVKPWFEEEVVVQARRSGTRLVLENIDLAELSD